MKYLRPRGTRDIFDSDANILNFIERTCEETFINHGYHQIYTPVFESAELFARGIGASTDIVHKEMYQFTDRSNRQLALRPEVTACVVRAVIENKLLAVNDVPYKVFYNQTCYRYERPQEGRFREFRQAGVEVIGTSNCYLDIEMIIMVASIFRKIGLGDVEVRINNLGSTECQNRYKEALKDYLKDIIGMMCENCQRRYLENPLRILDCKESKDQLALLSAPLISDFITEEDKERLRKVIDFFKDDSSVTIKYDPHLVRGLDYYNQIVFEFYVTNSSLSVGALGGGGCYDRLVKEISDNTDVPGSGFSLGLDRLQMVMKEQIGIPVILRSLYIAPLNERGVDVAHRIIFSLMKYSCSKETTSVAKSMKSHLKAAIKGNFKYIMFIGEDELAGDEFTIKNLELKTQEKIALKDFLKWADVNLTNTN